MAVTVSRETHPRVTLKGANSGTVNSGILVGSGDGNRVSMTFTATAEPIIVIPEGPVSDAQLEAGAFETSYIPNTADSGTVTRSPDIASIPVSAFGYNQTAGTVVVESTYEGLDAAKLGRYLEFNGTSPATERILLYRDPSNTTLLQIRNDGVDSVGLPNTNTPIGDTSVAAIAYKTNSANLCTNGTLNAADPSVVVPDDITTLDIGSASSARSDTGKVYIKSIQYFPRRLTDAQLQELTS